MPGYELQKKTNKDMPANEFKKSNKKTKDPAKGSAGRFFSEMLDGSLLTRKTTQDLFPFIIYLSCLALFLIFNTYYAERKAREADQLRREMTELRINYIHTKSEYMYLTNRSELANRLSSRNFIEPVEPPGLIVNKKEEPNLLRRLFR